LLQEVWLLLVLLRQVYPTAAANFANFAGLLAIVDKTEGKRSEDYVSLKTPFSS
jgi:hypothetical protein